MQQDCSMPQEQAQHHQGFSKLAPLHTARTHGGCTASCFCILHTTCMPRKGTSEACTLLLTLLLHTATSLSCTLLLLLPLLLSCRLACAQKQEGQ